MSVPQQLEEEGQELRDGLVLAEERGQVVNDEGERGADVLGGVHHELLDAGEEGGDDLVGGGDLGWMVGMGE